MWVLLVLLHLSALHCAVSSSPPNPSDVVFSSVNLRNLLHWYPGNGTSADTHFTVQYAIYGDTIDTGNGKRVNWRPVRHCTEMAQSWCDLTEETWDVEQGYHGRVRAIGGKASSKWAVTWRRFDPKSDTTFGPPLISVDIEDNSAIITLMGPMRYQSHNLTPVVSMATVYPQLTYNLSVHNIRRDRMHHFPVVSSLYKYRLMEYSTEYCFSAKTRFLLMPVKCQPSGWHCITTPEDPVIGQLKRVVVGIVVPSLCLCMCLVVGYVLYHYLSGSGQKSPYILDAPSFHPPLLPFSPENDKIMVITVIKAQDSLITKNGTSDLESSNQRLALEPPRDSEEPLDDVSSYCGVSDVHLKDELNAGEERKGDCDKTSMDNMYTQPQLPQISLNQSQPLSQSVGARAGGWGGAKEGAYIDQNPQSYRFQTPLQTNEEDDMVGVTKRKILEGTDGTMDEDEQEERETHKQPLLSGYASQNIKSWPTVHAAGQSDATSDDYGLLLGKQEIEDNGFNCVKWDPTSKQPVFPDLSLVKDGGLVSGWRGRGNGTRGELKLESVFVRQGSEDETEVQRGVETRWEADDVLAKWDLVIPID